MYVCVTTYTPVLRRVHNSDYKTVLWLQLHASFTIHPSNNCFLGLFRLGWFLFVFCKYI